MATLKNNAEINAIESTLYKWDAPPCLWQRPVTLNKNNAGFFRKRYKYIYAQSIQQGI